MFSVWESVWNFGYTPRKPLGAVHFTTLKSLVSVSQRRDVSRSLYIDLSFANRMTERQTVLLPTDLMLLLYVLLVLALYFPYSTFCTSDLSLSLFFLYYCFSFFFIIKNMRNKEINRKEREREVTDTSKKVGEGVLALY